MGERAAGPLIGWLLVPGSRRRDSTAAMAAWMLDHDTTQLSEDLRCIVGGRSARWQPDRDNIVDKVMLYWLRERGPGGPVYWNAHELKRGGRPRSPRGIESDRFANWRLFAGDRCQMVVGLRWMKLNVTLPQSTLPFVLYGSMELGVAGSEDASVATDAPPAASIESGWQRWFTVVFPRTEPQSSQLSRVAVGYLVAVLGGR